MDIVRSGLLTIRVLDQKIQVGFRWEEPFNLANFSLELRVFFFLSFVIKEDGAIEHVRVCSITSTHNIQNTQQHSEFT